MNSKSLLPFLNVLLVLVPLLFCQSGNLMKTETAEFIYPDGVIPSCHASTVLVLENGDVLAAWFGGKEEGDNSVEIWLARRHNGTWSNPQKMTDYPDVPTWNPVLFQDNSKKIWLFFKVGESPRAWSGAFITSTDNGTSWSDITIMPAGLLGPIKNKPIQLHNGDIVSGTSVESYQVWSGWTEISSDGGQTWKKSSVITCPEQPYGIIQPTLWEYAPGKLKMLLRSRNLNYIVESHSEDGGYTWSPGKVIKSLPHPGSGIDAVKMNDGTIALVYNHTKKGRTPLNLAFSTDNGETWGEPYILENQPGEYSYPAIVQADDGKLHITYTWKREKIKYVIINPKGLY